MRDFRILVTGSRSCTGDQAAYIKSMIQDACIRDRLTVGARPAVIVHGKCPHGGVDLAAHEWAEAAESVHPEAHPADWAQHGRAAGPIRNAAMVALGADLRLAFPAPGSRGTWDCIRKAADAGIPVQIFPLAGGTR